MDIKITPRKLSGKIIAPSSKSELHRLLICAALSDKKSEIFFNGICDDILATIGCLNSLGAKIKYNEKCIMVEPIKNVPKSATLDCNESGSTLRFLLPVAAALGVRTKFVTRGSLTNRPAEPLLDEMSKHGVDVISKAPVEICGQLQSGEYSIGGNISSQFITGLLLALPLCDGESSLKITTQIESENYINLTLEILEKFGVKITKKSNEFSIKKSQLHAGNFIAEGDWSNAAFWLASGIEVHGLCEGSLQGDKKIIEIIKENPTEIDAKNIPDLVPIISVLSAAKTQTTRIYNAGRLRLKESDRIHSTVEMLKNLGVDAEEKQDEIIIRGNGKIIGGTVDSFNDHRIVMSAAIAAQFCEKPVIIKDAQAVNKSYPAFFEEYKMLGGKSDVM